MKRTVALWAVIFAIMMVGKFSHHAQTESQTVSVVIRGRTVVMSRDEARETLTALIQALGIPNSQQTQVCDGGQVH